MIGQPMRITTRSNKMPTFYIDGHKIEQQDRFGGLNAPGECGCLKQDLAPCGSRDPDNAGWINGCEPGQRHDDPRPGHEHEWAIGCSKTTMTAEDFDALSA